ncbi:hypothetical protein PanWU01x14_251130 [Parasponia andersonii]|uniref:Uncharacterized protein n=1 Tax=Parasponia andersonii TaxID=3476 RepID=A0A2P5BCT5_PARAD|nr:hypothetical protein PanWU01x14_251130 [Parasponia andersonii]
MDRNLAASEKQTLDDIQRQRAHPIALHTTTHRPAFSTPPLFPAKTQISANSTLCIAGGILRLKFPADDAVYGRILAAAATQKYVYPDPVPKFAEAETEKFRAELLKMPLKEKESFGDDLDSVVQVCVEIFNKFLRMECGGPGTLLVEPMMIALKERNLAGAPLAVLGHHCYGLKTTLIKIGKLELKTTQTPVP